MIYAYLFGMLRFLMIVLVIIACLKYIFKK